MTFHKGKNCDSLLQTYAAAGMYFKFMLTAQVIAMVGLYTLRGVGLIQFPAPPATYLAGNLK